jgi:hypothetical protein
MIINYFGLNLTIPDGYKFIAADKATTGTQTIFCYKQRPWCIDTNDLVMWTSRGNIDTAYQSLGTLPTEIDCRKSLVELKLVDMREETLID